MKNMRQIAENILEGLNNLDHKSNTIEKLNYSYKNQQIEIILIRLRLLEINERERNKK
ncbi:hypothetical protein LCGC14_2909960 [marine sediment metagenome]|uniref:Uncharacterized protein n=1 Tax=marine sediment metagenome TaxID=412755 RepID=A0A0F8YDQ3_9ZZZZ